MRDVRCLIYHKNWNQNYFLRKGNTNMLVCNINSNSLSSQKEEILSSTVLKPISSNLLYGKTLWKQQHFTFKFPNSTGRFSSSSISNKLTNYAVVHCPFERLQGQCRIPKHDSASGKCAPRKLIFSLVPVGRNGSPETNWVRLFEILQCW